MAITYPGTLDVFVNPAGTNTLDSPDHAQQHSDVNDAVEAGQAVLGTTAGTSVLKNFAAGDFPARINASNVLQQTIQGTINSSTLGTPTVTGGTFNAVTLGTPSAAGGTFNASTIGTPAITGGTATSVVMSSPTYVGIVDGWISSSDTWTYASASTFTIAGVDRTAVYTKGTRLKFTQTTVKYAVVVSSSFSTNTTVTIAVNTNYTIANAAITSPYYSYHASPSGYPSTFTWATTWGGFSTNPTGTWKYAITGNLCTMQYAVATAGTSNAASFSFTVPVASARAITGLYSFGLNNGSLINDCAVNSSGATFNCFTSIGGGGWNTSGAKEIYVPPFTYEF